MSAIRAEEIVSILKDQIKDYASELQLEDRGTVIQVGDGIARVFGLANCMAAEMLEFPGGVMGMALNLEEESVGVVLLGDFTKVKEGDYVRRTGRVLQVPVGDAVIGRVINPLGQPLDGKGPVNTTDYRPLERKADGVVYRQPVKQPLQTGLKAIDSMIPIGRGQRELVIGDRATGKSAMHRSTRSSTRNPRTAPTPRCGASTSLIGQKESTIARTVAKLEEHGAMEYTTRRRRRGLRPGAAAVHRALRRLRHRRALPVQRPGRAGGLRRPDQAGRGIPHAVAAAAPPAGPRSLSGRRVLLPQPPAGARGEAGRLQDCAPAATRTTRSARTTSRKSRLCSTPAALALRASTACRSPAAAA